MPDRGQHCALQKYDPKHTDNNQYTAKELKSNRRNAVPTRIYTMWSAADTVLYAVGSKRRLACRWITWILLVWIVALLFVTPFFNTVASTVRHGGTDFTLISTFTPTGHKTHTYPIRDFYGSVGTVWTAMNQIWLPSLCLLLHSTLVFETPHFSYCEQTCSLASWLTCRTKSN